MAESMTFEAPAIFVDEEFQSILPVLDEETYAMLEENLLQNGCVYPLVLWENILIDGHNRYEICTKHEIPFSTVSKEFESRDEALIWIVISQVARRNLSPVQLTYYRGLHYRTDKKISGGNNQYSINSEKVHNEPQQKEEATASRLAKHYRVSRSTIKRDAKVAEAIDAIGMTSPEAKKSILSGETSITKKYLNELISGINEDIAETAVRIEKGTFEKKRSISQILADGSALYGAAHAELDPLHAAVIKLSNDFNADLQKLVKDSDTAGLKTVIRFFIEALEDVYEQM